jgi:hypothetical protein
MAARSRLGANADVRPSSFERAMAKSACCSYFRSRFLQSTCPQEFIRLAPVGIGPGWIVLGSGAGADQAQRNKVAALAIISQVMMRLSPGR